MVTNPADVDPEAVAKLDRGDVQFHFRHGGPKVELVAGRTTIEAAKRISCQMNRTTATSGRCRAVDRARAAELISACLTRHKADQSENVRYGNLRANGLKIHAWQKRFSLPRQPQGSDAARSKTVHREEEPVSPFPTREFNPSIVAATHTRNTVYALGPGNQPTNSVDDPFFFLPSGRGGHPRPGP